MIKLLLYLIISLLTIRGSCQQKDTIRIYRYEMLFDFKLIIKNKKSFTYISDHSIDTIKGVVNKQDGVYRMDTGTNLLDKYQKRKFAFISKNIWLEDDSAANDLLMHISSKMVQWNFGDTTKVLDGLLGAYISTNGFVGCELKLDAKSIKLQPFSDMGGKGQIETVSYVRDYKGIKLVDPGYIYKWFTDNKRFIVLPYMLIGKRVQNTSKAYTETYIYFIKTNE